MLEYEENVEAFNIAIQNIVGDFSEVLHAVGIFRHHSKMLDKEESPCLWTVYGEVNVVHLLSDFNDGLILIF